MTNISKEKGQWLLNNMVSLEGLETETLVLYVMIIIVKFHFVEHTCPTIFMSVTMINFWEVS